MQRYRYSGLGTPLSSANGQIIRLPFSNSDQTWPAFTGTLLAVQFDVLTTERWLTTESTFRLKILADGSVWLAVNAGLDGPNASAIFSCTQADMAAAGVVLTTTRPHLFFVEPISFGNDQTRSTGMIFRLWVDGLSLPLTHTDTGSYAWNKSDPTAIGGNNLASYSDFCIFEYAKTIAPHPTAYQMQVLFNGGRGVDLVRLHWIASKIFWHTLFSDSAFDAGNQWFEPVNAKANYFTQVANANAQAYSSAFRTEYGDTNRLYFDGLNDYVAPVDTSQIISSAAFQAFTVEVDLIPNKTVSFPAEGIGNGSVGFGNAPDLASVLSSYFYLIPAYTGIPWLIVGTNGVVFGIAYKTDYGNIGFQTLISYVITLSTTQFQRVGIRFGGVGNERRAQLFINGVLKYTGQQTDSEISPGSTHGDWPIYLPFTAGQPTPGYAGNSGPWSGWMRRFRLWNIARTDAQMSSSTLPVGTEAGLLLYWPLDRVDSFGAGQPFSTSIADKAGQVPAKLVNYVLSPVSPTYRKRIGRAILS